MPPFIQFWIDCFYIGWQIADGIINVIGTVALLVSAVLLWRKKWNHHRRRWEEFALRATLIVFVAAFLFSTVFVAPFLKYDRDAKKTENGDQWQPPELFPGTKTAYFSMGGRNWDIPLKDATKQHPYLIHLLTNDNPISIYKYDNRIYVNQDFKQRRSTNIVSGLEYKLGVFDSEIQSDYDRNFSPNAFEVVNQDCTPVFQLIYNRPNDITFNGVILFTEGLKPLYHEGEPVDIGIFFAGHVSHYTSINNDDTRRYLLLYKTNVLFKYPSRIYPGQYNQTVARDAASSR